MKSKHLFCFSVDEDTDRRRMLRMKVTQGVQIAEGLKKRIRETTTNSGFTPSSLSSPTLTHTNDRKCNY